MWSQLQTQLRMQGCLATRSEAALRLNSRMPSSATPSSSFTPSSAPPPLTWECRDAWLGELLVVALLHFLHRLGNASDVSPIRPGTSSSMGARMRTEVSVLSMRGDRGLCAVNAC